MSHSLRPTKSLEPCMESPLHGLLHRLIEYEWQKGHSSQAELEGKVSVILVQTAPDLPLLAHMTES